MKKEVLLTQVEIETILNDLPRNAVLSYPYAVTILVDDDLPTKIVSITPNNHLILVKGNDDTGYTHICKRHGKFAYAYYSFDDPIDFYKDNPTKFHSSFAPVDYKFIIDQIYHPNNLIESKRPDEFDSYSGITTYKNITDSYLLVTYKNTKIVHSFFPVTKPKINNFPHVKGMYENDIDVEISVSGGPISYTVNFKNSADTIVAKLIYKEYPLNLFGTVQACCITKNNQWKFGEEINYQPSHAELDFSRNIDTRVRIIRNFKVPIHKELIKKIRKVN